MREVVDEELVLEELSDLLKDDAFEIFSGPPPGTKNKLAYHMEYFASAVILIGKS